MPAFQKLLFRIAWFLSACMLCAGAALAQASAPRIALVIGNSDYINPRIPNLNRLPSAVNDAQDMRDALRRAGFEVIYVDNAGHERLFSAIVEFGQRLAARPDAVPLFYFSGHGMQLDRREGSPSNVLLPVDLPSLSNTEIERRGLHLDTVIREMNNSRAQPKIVILDACRTPGFGKDGVGKGLARVSNSGFLIAFASEPGKPSYDDFTTNERNSRYTKHLLTQLRQGGQRLEEVFINTRRLLEADPLNRDRQASEETNRLTVAEPFYFLGGGASANRSAQAFAPPAPAAPLAPPVAQPPRLADLQTFKDCPDCPEMVVIPAGSFMMGSPASENGRDDDEGPQRRVNVDRFAIGKTEVTQGQWKSVMGSNPSYFSNCGDNCPVENVSWNDAQAFIKRLNAKTGQSYRLPSEAEWEYAARAGSQTRYSFGDDETQLGRYAWYIENSGRKTQRVGQKQDNVWGLHDMHGNVWEWVYDCWEDNYSKGQPRDGSAHKGMDANCTRRARRGGSWDNGPQVLRSAIRFRGTPDSRSDGYGFRLSRTAP